MLHAPIVLVFPTEPLQRMLAVSALVELLALPRVRLALTALVSPTVLPRSMLAVSALVEQLV